MWKIPVHRWSKPKEPIRPEDYVGDDEKRNEQVVRERFPAKARRYLALLPLAKDVVAMYFCMLDPRTPLWVKGTAAAALAYFILPIDAIPDMLPIVGFSDDASVLAAAIAAISSHITAEHRKKATDWLQTEQIDPSPAPGEVVP
ncbi:YkvA family protein [soil metagenome]